MVNCDQIYDNSSNCTPYKVRLPLSNNGYINDPAVSASCITATSLRLVMSMAVSYSLTGCDVRCDGTRLTAVR